jgi:hypothetical protein
MNERLQELYEQSMKVVSYTDGGYTEIKALDADKFAELIVRECVNICMEHPSRIKSNNWSPTTVATDIGNRLNEHFGVE